MTPLLSTLVVLLALLGLTTLGVAAAAAFYVGWYYTLHKQLPMSPKDQQLKLLEAKLDMAYVEIEELVGRNQELKESYDEVLKAALKRAFSGE